MAKFNLKEHIAKNKATFFGSLTEGQFSWFTQDTDQQIGSEKENTIPVYMFDDKGKYWFEPSYEGYGVFGGKDYYELLDQMNGGIGNRSEGIRKAFDPTLKSKLLFPALVGSANNFNYKTHDFTQEAESDPNQSWYVYPEYDEEDEFYRGDDDYDGGEEELDEAKIEEKYNTFSHKIAEKFAEYMSKKEGRNFTVTPNSVDEYSFDLDVDGLRYEGGSYLIKGDDIINVAVSGNPVYAKLNQLEEGYDEFKRADKGSKDVTAKDKGEEDVYGAGVKKGEQIEKKKMKKSELKAKIKEMIVAEIALDIDSMENAPESEVDFLSEIEAMLNENLPVDDPRVEQIISMLKDMDADGETMEYIIRQVGMEDQMANQLVHYPAEYAASLNEAEGLTPLQDYVYQYEIEISGEDRAQEFLDDIKKLNTPDDVYNYYAYDRDWEGSMDDDLENIYRQVRKKFKNLNEADETEKDTAETDTGDDVTVDDTETTDVETTAEVDPNVKAVQDSLTQAQAAAQQLGDKKLIDQIGNTITFFTRAHVVEKPKGAVAESMFPMLKKILK